ncbi:hypothetical protein [Streptomyces atriruber]|uniref:hypothetical protein n=1 Tax=Streptomyces atriruber TaxID=545121 RepID=UPI0006E3E656|nr:hypothetical protein [Streptomyces atriruber]
MPIAFQNATSATGNNVATYAVSAPSGTASGDMLILAVSVSESAGVVPTVTGSWTQKLTVNQVTSGDDQDNTLSLFWRRASSEPGSYTVTPDGTYGNYSAASVLRYTGVISSGDPFRASATATGGATLGTPRTSATLSGVQTSDLALHCAGAVKATWNTDTFDPAGPGGSWVERGEIRMTSASTGMPAILYLEQSGTGTAPSFSATGTASANLAWCFCAGALMEEPAQTGPGERIFSTAVRRASTW